MVVEDDCLILLNARLLLESAGYRVLEAADAAAALRLIDAHPEVTAVFTDVAMPGAMDGLALAAAIGRVRPGLPVYITSGSVEVAEEALPEGTTFLAKPYTAAKLMRLLAA
jgi:two-component system, response regulator PdtaR